MPDPTARVLTPKVLVLLLAGVTYFTVTGISFPVLPRLVERELDGSKTQIGLAFAVFAVGMLVMRPFAGYLSDRLGRRAVMVTGASLLGICELLHVPAARHGGYLALLGVRVLAGMASSVMYLGQATVATEMSPPQLRSQVFATFSIAVVAGFVIGNPLGELVLEQAGFSAAFGVAAAFAFASAALGLLLPETRPAGLVARLGGVGDLLHPVAARVGLINLLVFTAFMGFNAFIADYAEELGLDEVKWILLTYSLTTLVMRLGLGRLLDTVDRRRLGTFSHITVAIGAVMLALAPTAGWLYPAAFVLAVGLSFNVPLLVLVAVDSASDVERSQVVATVTVFGDLANSAGAFALGAVADRFSYEGMYLVIAASALGAAVLLNSRLMAPVSGLRPRG